LGQIEIPMGSSMRATAILLLASALSSLFYLVLLLLVELPRRALLRKKSDHGKHGGEFRSVLITGASVGIGAGLARKFAKPGVRLVLTAFREPSLGRTVKECEELGAEVEAHYIDVKDRAAMEVLIEEANAKRRLNLVVANAGVTAVENGLEESHWVMETNLMGMLNTVVPAVKAFRESNAKRRQIAILSSVGSFAPATNFFMLPYVASKTAIRNYGEGLRMCLASEGIGVTVITPGFVETRMVALQAKQGIGLLGLWSNEEATELMKQGIENNEPRVVFPWFLYLLSVLSGSMPPFITELIGPDRLGRFDPYRLMDEDPKKHIKVDMHEDTVKGSFRESPLMAFGRNALRISILLAVAFFAHISLS